MATKLYKNEKPTSIFGFISLFFPMILNKYPSYTRWVSQEGTKNGHQALQK
jgi:hypothetical protein